MTSYLLVMTTKLKILTKRANKMKWKTCTAAGSLIMILGINVFAQSVCSETVFRKGLWEKDKWFPIRLIEQKESRTFDQRDDCIGNDSFPKEEIGSGLDNIILITDTKKNQSYN